MSEPQSLTAYLLGQPLTLVALAGLLLAALGWQLERQHHRLGQRLRSTGYLAMLAAGALIAIDAARRTSSSDAAFDLVGQTEAQISGGETIIPLGADGHFHALVRINGREVPMLIDTGATFTSIEESAAQPLGLAPNRGRLPGEVSTANGVITARYAVAQRFEFGSIAVQDLEVAILPDTASPQAVLGMNLLSKLATWRVEGAKLYLVPVR